MTTYLTTFIRHLNTRDGGWRENALDRDRARTDHDTQVIADRMLHRRGRH